MKFEDLTDQQLDQLLTSLKLMQYIDEDAPRFVRIQRLIEYQKVDPEELETALSDLLKAK